MTVKRRAGFGFIPVLLIIAALAVLGFVGYRVYTTQASKNMATGAMASQKTSTQGSTQQSSSNLNDIYTDPVGNFSVRHPSTWKLAKQIASDNPEAKVSRVTLTSPGGTVLNLDADEGGRGGACEPLQADKPFQAGNRCPSSEYLSSELLPVHNLYYAAPAVNSASSTVAFKPAQLMLVTEHFASPDGSSQYLIGLAESTPEIPITVNQPVMGYSVGLLYFGVYNAKGTFLPYIYAYASSPTQSFLTSNDAATIKQILRTIKLAI